MSYQYTDFGETSIHGDKDFYNELCYNESIYDESTGLYYLSARYYDPEDSSVVTVTAEIQSIHLHGICMHIVRTAQ